MAIHPLQSSGQISYGDVNEELGRSRTTQISLYSAENGYYFPLNNGSPYKPTAGGSAAISEWYGYNHISTSVTLYVAIQLLNLNSISPAEIDNEFKIYDVTAGSQLVSYNNFAFDTYYNYYEVTLYVGHTYFCQGEINENSSNSYVEAVWYPSSNPTDVNVTYFEHCQTYDYGRGYEQVKFTINSATSDPELAYMEVFGGGFIASSGTPYDSCAAPNSPKSYTFTAENFTSGFGTVSDGTNDNVWSLGNVLYGATSNFTTYQGYFTAGPLIGSTLYTSSAMNVVFNGEGLFFQYSIIYNSLRYLSIIQISNSGVVLDASDVNTEMPRNGTYSNLTPNSVILYWDKPVSQVTGLSDTYKGTSAFIGYNIYKFVSGSGLVFIASVSGSTYQYNITGLTSNTSYTYYIAAYSSNEESNAYAINFTTY